MASTQAAVAIDALVAHLTATVADVDVVDGPPLSMDEPDILSVGFSPTGRESVSVTQTRTGLDEDRRSEAVAVVCMASAWRGQTNLSLVRQDCVAILNKVKASLAANRTLGNTVARSSLGLNFLFDQAQTTDGASVSVEFTIDLVTY